MVHRPSLPWKVLAKWRRKYIEKMKRVLKQNYGMESKTSYVGGGSTTAVQSNLAEEAGEQREEAAPATLSDGNAVTTSEGFNQASIDKTAASVNAGHLFIGLPCILAAAPHDIQERKVVFDVARADMCQQQSQILAHIVVFQAASAAATEKVAAMQSKAKCNYANGESNGDGTNIANAKASCGGNNIANGKANGEGINSANGDSNGDGTNIANAKTSCGGNNIANGKSNGDGINSANGELNGDGINIANVKASRGGCNIANGKANGDGINSANGKASRGDVNSY
jgi:hypothetical protein